MESSRGAGLQCPPTPDQKGKPLTLTRFVLGPLAPAPFPSLARRRVADRISYPSVVEKGVREVLAAGPLAGYAMQNVRVIVYDGKHHSVDSKEVAFVSAGKKAFLDAILKARPIVLEPILNIEINAREANMGGIAGDISSKRSQIGDTQSAMAGTVTIADRVPPSELNNYKARLKSVTAGQGSYVIEL